MDARNKVLFSKKELVSGVEEALDGSNAIKTIDLEITPIDGQLVEHNYDSPAFGSSGQEHASTFIQFKFKVEFQGSGTAGLSPAYAHLLDACQWDETVDVDKNDFALSSPSATSVTLAGYKDGNLHKGVMGKGTVDLVIDSQGYPYYEFTFTALYITPSSAAAPSPTGWDDFKAARPVNNAYTSQLTLHGQPLTLISFRFSQGNQVEHFDNPGEEAVEITGRKCSGNIRAKSILNSTKNFFQTAELGTRGALLLTHGIASGEICQISAVAVQLIKPKYGDDRGRLTIDSELDYVYTSALDDEVAMSLCRDTI